MGRSKKKEKHTYIKLDEELPRKPKKPRHLGSGFHKDGRRVRNETRLDQLRNSIEAEEESEND